MGKLLEGEQLHVYKTASVACAACSRLLVKVVSFPGCHCQISLTIILVQERKAAVIRAEGESESAKLISDATKAAGPGIIELRRIEAAKDIAATMSKSGNVVYLPGGGNMLLGLNSGAGR